MRKTVAILLLLGALGASAAINAYYTTRTDERAASDMGEPTNVAAQTKRVCPSLDELKLTSTQRAQLSGCCGKCGTWRNQLQQKTDALIAELERQLNATSFNKERIYQLADEIGELRAQELKSRVHSIVQVRETLTPSQLERLVAAAKEPFAVPDAAKEKGE